MNYGKILKQIRLSHNLTQQDMANILHITRQAYGHFETQTKIIPITHLIEFANYFNIAIDYIFDFTLNHSVTCITPTPEMVGKRLKEVRKALNLTQVKLASIINTNQSVIAGYEHGRNIIATPFLYDFCKKYHLSADYILCRNNTSMFTYKRKSI